MTRKLKRQDVFDRVWDRFVTQGKPLGMEPSEPGESPYSHKGCYYRYPHTPEAEARCAIGMFIPDELYDPVIEGPVIHFFDGEDRLPDPAYVRVTKYLNTLFNRNSVTLPFLGDLQAAHDSAVSGKHTIEAALIDFAHTYNLRIPSAN